ncbi:MAG: polysulfide reductase NrfD [Chloroflexi bacterium]|nr:polysulfide reductase NrfD [Chloroflexota bacterium]
MNTLTKSLLAVLWVLALGAGIVGLYLRFTTGHQLAGYNSYITWGLWVAAYVYFIGLSAGAFLLSSLVYVFRLQRLEPIGKLSLFTAVICLVGALVSISLDLGHMERAWMVLTQPNPASMMAWMVWLYTAYFLLLLAELWFALRADLVAWSSREGLQGTAARLLTFGIRDTSARAVARDRSYLRVLGTIGVPLAVAFHGGVGALFGVVGARGYWNASIFPLMFLVGALLSGGALLTCVVAFLWPQRGTAQHRDLVGLLGKMTLGLLILYLIMLWSEFSITLYASIPAESQPYYQVLGGPYPWVFWGFQVAIGSAIPILLLVFASRSIAATGVAGLLVAGAFLATRLNVVIPGFVVPVVPGLESAYIDQRLSFDYFPSTLEWLVLLFIGALASGLFYLGYVGLPVTTTREEVRSHG